MPYLNCGVDDCIHNYNFFCGLPDIRWTDKGKGCARNALLQLRKSRRALTNTLRFEQPDPQTDVACSAENHMFNADACAEPYHRKLRHDLRGRRRHRVRKLHIGAKRPRSRPGLL